MKWRRVVSWDFSPMRFQEGNGGPPSGRATPWHSLKGRRNEEVHTRSCFFRLSSRLLAGAVQTSVDAQTTYARVRTSVDL